MFSTTGLDPGDRQVLEQKYNGCDPPCLLDSSDGRLVVTNTNTNINTNTNTNTYTNTMGAILYVLQPKRLTFANILVGFASEVWRIQNGTGVAESNFWGLRMSTSPTSSPSSCPPSAPSSPSSSSTSPPSQPSSPQQSTPSQYYPQVCVERPLLQPNGCSQLPFFKKRLQGNFSPTSSLL